MTLQELEGAYANLQVALAEANDQKAKAQQAKIDAEKAAAEAIAQKKIADEEKAKAQAAQAKTAELLKEQKERADRLADQLGSPMIETLKGLDKGPDSLN